MCSRCRPRSPSGSANAAGSAARCGRARGGGKAQAPRLILRPMRPCSAACDRIAFLEGGHRTGAAHANAAMARTRASPGATSTRHGGSRHLAGGTKELREHYADMVQLASDGIERDPYDAARTWCWVMRQLAWAQRRGWRLRSGHWNSLRAPPTFSTWRRTLGLASASRRRAAELCDRSFRLNPHPPAWYEHKLA